MSLRGKREGIKREDLLAAGVEGAIATRPKVEAVIEQVEAALARWTEFAESAKVDGAVAEKIGRVIGS